MKTVILRTILAGAVGLMAGQAMAGDLASSASDVAWIAAPSRADVAAAYPAKARTKGVGGEVLLDCQLGRDGRATVCEVIDETAPGLGFASAARALGQKFQAPATDAVGRPVARSHVQIVIGFTPDLLDPSKTGGGRPKWVAMPPPAAFNESFPPKAQVGGVLKARVVLACTATADGGLSGCAVESEDPPGYELGRAALGLAPGFRMAAWGSDGRPVIGATVKAGIRYDMQQVPQ